MRCKCCRDTFEVRYFNQKYCLSKMECIKAHVEHSKKLQKKAWDQKKKQIKDDLKTTTDYLKEAQYWFNKIIRERDKDKPCISCGVSLQGRKYDAGHYFSQGGHSAVRYHVNNCHAQCVKCNRDLSANLIEYRKGLIERIGEAKLMELYELAYQERKYDIEELKKMIQEYKKIYKDMTLDKE